MKTPKHKLPKARVMFCDDDPRYPADVRFQVHGTKQEALDSAANKLPVFHCAVIPGSPKDTSALVRFANMTEEERVERVAKILAPDCGKWAGENARAILREIFP